MTLHAAGNLAHLGPGDHCRNRDKGHLPDQQLGFILVGATPAPSWVQSQLRALRSPEDSSCCRHPSTPGILRSLVSGPQHQFQKTQRVLLAATGSKDKGEPQHTQNIGITETSLPRRAHGQQKEQSFLERVPSGLHPQPGDRAETQRGNWNGDNI